MERVSLPRHVDAPQRFLLWTVDQAIPFLLFVGFGIVLDMLMLSIIGGIAVSYYFNRYKESRSDGFIKHMFWWYGMAHTGAKVRSVVNPFMRRIFPA
ncbi:type IV conjugative transfer system protein TraL [Rhodanobacter denitrificans]|uniref:type IV conjugative transfer system protein TraL n=1 Tax=Rhodanobacter denitrificans TaxID=666685 RepID=UPI001F3D6915|nr:type IV conjugative transfer system protein TraL [Rhodanobacter denitrificans]UJJ60580.1 type IV conjugative transfer system protein TraL [Rhodanobacter denitrificans]